ncbi:MAG: hypothetical protein AAGU05_05380 [Anaerolineaceae bacterium]
MKKPQNIKLDHHSLKRLIESIKHTCDEEPNCEQVYELLDEYAEQELQGVHPQDLMPLVHHHLEICPDCHEEYDMLLEILRARKENPQ